MVRKRSAQLLFILTLTALPVHASQTATGGPAASGSAALADGVAAPVPGPASSEEPAATATAAAAVNLQGGDGDPDRINGKYLKGYITDSGKLLTSPLRWDATDWAKAGAVAGLTGGLFLADRSIRDFTQRNKSSVADRFASVGNFIGDPLYAPAYVGSFYLYGIFRDDPKARRTALLALKGYALSSLFSTGIKTLAQRHRPETGDSHSSFDGPQWNGKNFSFASGHTSNAFAMATVFANEYRDKAYVPPLAYGLATLTAAARVYDNKHWSSDVFFGAALGYFTSKGLLALHKKNDAGFVIMPQVNKDVVGVSVGCTF